MTSFPLFLVEMPWITTVVWAVVVVFFLVLFRAPITKFLARLSQVKLKADKTGVELSFQAQQAEAGEFLALATETKAKSSGIEQPPDAKETAQKTVREAAPRTEAERFSRAEVLWVDDHPDNNIHERKAFEAIGLRFTLARSTEEALTILGGRDRPFAAIISDMGRPPDPRAGYTLLDTLRSPGRGDKTPFIIYAGSSAPEHKRETTEHGGQGCTNYPEELFRLVTKAIIEGPTA